MHIHAGGFLVNQSRTQEELTSNNIQLIYLKLSLFLFFKLGNAYSKNGALRLVGKSFE